MRDVTLLAFVIVAFSASRGGALLALAGSLALYRRAAS